MRTRTKIVLVFFFIYAVLLSATTVRSLAEEPPYETIDILMVVVQTNLTENELENALNAINDLETKVYEYSDGMAVANVDMIFYKGDLPYIVTQKGSMFPDAEQLAARVDSADYDYVGSILSPSLIPIYKDGTRGMANITGTDTFWVAADERAEGVTLHELAHVIEADKVRSGYTNFPQCSENDRPGGGVHCSFAYGYSGSSSEDWLDDYYSGDLRDGTGLTEEGWKS